MTVSFTVNGKAVSLDKDKKLLRFLRDDLKLTSAKDGCSEGACGTCTVLVNGKTVRACSVLTSEVAGADIVTVEGLSENEKQVFTYAFGEEGAVQCGFCIPGMIICAKGLIDKNPDPSEFEIRHAIRNNICRCTGYAKIVKAITLAAKIFREQNQNGSQKRDFKDDRSWKIGKRVPRVDVKDKVTGNAVYPDDIYMDGMLFVVAVRSKYPRARVLGIEKNMALDVPGVVGIFTAEDIPGSVKVGHIKRDWDALIPVGQITRYLGDAICLIAAESFDAAKKAKSLVKVSYEELPCITSPYEAMKPDAPKIHADGNILGHIHVDRGNAEEAIKNSKHVLTEKFSTPWTEHAFLEPECAVSVPLENGGVKIYSTDQGVYDTRRETAPMLGLPEEKVLVENCYVGGAFGGKEDVSVQHLSALAAILTKRPCKMKLTREESLIVHPKRHPMYMEFSLGCDENGIIQGLKASIISDTGAYASLGIPVLQRACTHASGPYNYQNFKIDGYAYYTNNPPAGAFRGFGVTQSCFAIETILNHMADEVGISHWEIRFRNAIRPGQSLPNGQIVDESTGLAETLMAVKDEFYSHPHAGIACAMKNAGVGVGLPDYGRVRLEVKDGKVIIHCGGSCLGQGMCTVMKQIVCDVTGLERDKVVEEKANSFNAPDSGTSSGSRHTTVSGEAARRAAVMLKEALEKDSLENLEGQDFYAEYLAETDEMGTDLPHPKSHVAYGYATQMCILEERTDKILKIVAAHDVGVAINPTNVEGQIEGGVVMGMGYALKEQYLVSNCIPLTKYASLKLFRADEVPKIEPIIVEKKGLNIASGAIGLGEIVCIPTAPAIADAYYRFDGMKRNSLPIQRTPYEDPSDPKNWRGGRTLVVNNKARCIGCLECVHACAQQYFGVRKASLAFLRIDERTGIGNKSDIAGRINRPVVCIQCGKCAKVCPIGAIRQNQFGAYVVDLRMCTNCGKCRDVCPFSVIIESPKHVSMKCLACGKCVKACPMGVLSIKTPEAQKPRAINFPSVKGLSETPTKEN
ncbi:MAG: selenium-dependent xanthine dehydrogenase [Sphaerochaeta sp.]